MVSVPSEILESAHAHDPDAERYVIAAALAFREEHTKLIDLFSEEDFYVEAHRILYRGLLQVPPEERKFDAMRRPDLPASPEILDLAYTYIEGVPTRWAWDENAARVKKLSQRRRLAVSLQAAEKELSGSDPDAVVETLMASMEDILSEKTVRGAQHLSAYSTEVEDRALLARENQGVTGIRTGFGTIDRYLGGLVAGRSYIVAARAGVGKSTFAATVALNAARSGKKVLIQSTEMPGADYLERYARAMARISDDEWLKGKFSDEKLSRYLDALQKLRDLQLYIDDAPGATPATLRRNILRIQPDLVVVDYLQRMRSSRRFTSEYEAVTALSLDVDRLKGQYNVPILIVAQLNRNPEQRSGNRPFLSDLRGSGQLEQDANVVLLLHRPGIYDRSADPDTMEVYCAKNRHGEGGWTVEVYRQPGISYLTDDRNFLGI